MDTLFITIQTLKRRLKIYDSEQNLIFQKVMRTRFSQYLVVLVHEPASFWQGNMLAVIILPQFLARIW